MKTFALGLLVAMSLTSAAAAQTAPATLNSRGPLQTPAPGTLLAELQNIPAGPHTFRVVVSATGAASAAVVVEWRDARNRVNRWSQGIIVSETSGTVVVHFDEPHQFDEGERLRLVVFAPVTGTVWGTLSIRSALTQQ